ncbi:MAG: hypothetical protein H0X30_20890 [Anaerolineae bacterium]|nr:hypothetical protein [Anaerolineae bacterium]
MLNLSVFLFFLCASAVKPYCFCIVGGILPSIRRNDTAKNAAAATRETSAALAATAQPAAMQKCQFGGLLPHSRLPFRRKYCK